MRNAGTEKERRAAGALLPGVRRFAENAPGVVCTEIQRGVCAPEGDFAMPMDEGQSAAVRHGKGPLLVLAGPGSGKTTVITHRIKYITEELGADPSRITVMTFTKAAADEMQRRAGEICAAAGSVRFGTFHSVALSVLREETGAGEDSIMQENIRYGIISDLCSEHFPDAEDRRETGKKMSLALTLAAGNGYTSCAAVPGVCTAEAFASFLADYRAAVKATGLITFDDMLTDAVELLESSSEVREKWQERCQWLLVDEYQDSNPVQEKFLLLLAGSGHNVTAVGDDDQSIYGFRGADPKVMLSFPEKFPGTDTVHLSVNYRSDTEIVEASQVLIENNTDRYAKTPSSASGPGGAVKLLRCSTPAWQGKMMATAVRERTAAGVPLGKIAVICRTNREIGPVIESFVKERIPYVSKEKADNVYEHWIARDIFAYMQLAAGIGGYRQFAAVANRPVRYVGRDALSSCGSEEEVKEYYRREGKDYIADLLDKADGYIAEAGECIKNGRALDALDIIENRIGYADFLRKRAEETGTDYGEYAGVLESLEGGASEHQMLGEWFAYIKKFTAELKSGNASGSDAVHIMTMHASKGLEFDTVLIPDAAEGFTPYRMAKLPSETEEERRMFYVALTRAEHECRIFTPRTANGKDTEPSRFVREIKKGLERLRLNEAGAEIMAAAERNRERISDAEIKENEDRISAPVPVPCVIPENIEKNTPVTHPSFGKGFVQGEKDGKISVFFENSGKIFVLDRDFCAENGLLSFGTEKKKPGRKKKEKDAGTAGVSAGKTSGSRTAGKKTAAEKKAAAEKKKTVRKQKTAETGSAEKASESAAGRRKRADGGN